MMEKMLKRKKEGGFTLIELMIVIAIIGILAVVLVPKLSGSKDTAKSAGVLANAKSVEAYINGNISKWEKAGATGTNITAALTDGTNGAFKDAINPFLGTTGTAAVAVVVSGTADDLTAMETAAAYSQGKVIVALPTTALATALPASGNKILIKAWGGTNTEVVYKATLSN